jgi:hypothetical protein
MNPDVSGPVAGRQLLAVVRDPDATDAVPLVVRLLSVSVRV